MGMNYVFIYPSLNSYISSLFDSHEKLEGKEGKKAICLFLAPSLNQEEEKVSNLVFSSSFFLVPSSHL